MMIIRNNYFDLDSSLKKPIVKPEKKIMVSVI